jgi:hypothetical protein
LGELTKLKHYQEKLLLLMNLVARNDVSDAINNIFDSVSKHLNNEPEVQREIFSTICDVLKDRNQQLWFTISLRLGKIYLDQHSY